MLCGRVAEISGQEFSSKRLPGILHLGLRVLKLLVRIFEIVMTTGSGCKSVWPNGVTNKNPGAAARQLESQLNKSLIGWFQMWQTEAACNQQRSSTWKHLLDQNVMINDMN